MTNIVRFLAVCCFTLFVICFNNNFLLSQNAPAPTPNRAGAVRPRAAEAPARTAPPASTQSIAPSSVNPLAGTQTMPTGPVAPVSPVPDAAKTSPEITSALQAAADLFNKSNFAGSLKSLQELCAAHPELPPPRVIMAQWFAKAQLPDAIRISLESATNETPNDPEAYLLLGEIALREKQLTASQLLLAHADRLLTVYNASPERKKIMQGSLLRNQVALMEVRGKWDIMESFVDKRIALEGKTAELLRQKAVAEFRQNKDQQSAQLLVEADQLEANAPKKGLPAEAFLSQLYVVRGDMEKGRQLLNTALTKYPKSKEVLTLSVLMKVSDEDLVGARTLAEKLLAEDPQALPAKKLLATISLFQEDFVNAEKYFQELVLASPADSDATNGLALALCEQNDPAKLQKALEYATENVKKERNNNEYIGTLGWVLYKGKNIEQATKVLQQSAAGGNINSQTAYYFARILSENGKTDEAKQLLQASLQSKQPFAKKKEAKILFDSLNK